MTEPELRRFRVWFKFVFVDEFFGKKGWRRVNRVVRGHDYLDAAASALCQALQNTSGLGHITSHSPYALVEEVGDDDLLSGQGAKIIPWDRVWAASTEYGGLPGREKRGAKEA